MDLLHTPSEAVQWLRARVAGTLQPDSRNVAVGDGFIAWPGAATDGRKHVVSALEQGATACLVEAQGVEAFGFGGDDRIAAYAGLKAATGPIAAQWFGHPTQQLQVIAVTGTNGKTSTAWWLAQALSRAGRPCAVVGTLGAGRPPQVEFNGLTTPDPLLLQRRFRGFADEGLAACAIEASSVGIVERRLDGTRIAVAVFTNFTQDHLDYHGDMAAYWQAKSELFRWPGLQAAVVNLDDEKGPGLAQALAVPGGIDVWTVSCLHEARLAAQDIGYGAQGLRFTVVEGAERHAIATQLVGQYNVANLLGGVAAMRAAGVPLQQAVAACADLLPVPGRMERFGGQGAPLVAVDYAHTPDALDKALAALRPLAQQRGGRLWCVFGCGGDRDPTKRPLMAAVAEKNADQVVVTSDNPRSENPGNIISQILLGLSRNRCVQVQADRALAIAETVAAAGPQDVVLLAGKGHEDYQEVTGVKHPFDDRVHAQAAIVRYAQRSSHPLPQAGEGRGEGGAANDLFSLAEALDWLPGATLVGEGSLRPLRVHSDSRTLRAGDLFVALAGERFDGNDMIGDALKAGAVAVLAHRGRIPAGASGIEVDDSKAALGALAAGWRSRFRLPVVAVTGSNGKTTVTQMIASVLRAWRGADALATEGNFNNDIGLPLTLLRLRAHHRVAVLELGMNHPGEIATLAGLARPTVALVNNAQREHQEFMATVEAVARENGAVIAALADSGVAVFPAADGFTPVWEQLAGAHACLTFAAAGAPSGTRAADIVLAGTEWQDGSWQVQAATPAGPLAFRLHIAGRHNVVNALAAVACTLAAGAPLEAIARGLEAFEPVKGRSRAIGLRIEGRALTLVDDTYNANPDSVRAAIEVLAELPGPRLLVLGDMGEVGTQGPQFHAEVGAYARERAIERLFTLGEQAAAMGGMHFADVDALIKAVRAALPQSSSVLVKGSRFMKMERVVQAICALGQEPHATHTEAGHAA